MPSTTKRTASTFAAAALALGLFSLAPAAARQQQKGATTDADRQASRAQNAAGTAATLSSFEGRVKEYARLRERLEEELPKLPKDATAEQIESHKTAFQRMVRNARTGAKRGDVFTPAATAALRQLIRSEVGGEERREMREKVAEAENKGVVMRVNHPYPETQELVDIPPTLLIKLPQLPKQVKYRFVGRSLLLVDRENGLIVDFMPDALP